MPAGLPLTPELLAHWAKHKVHAEDLLGMQVAFHNLPGSSVYEDALRAHLQKSQLDFVDPHGFRTAGFRETVLLLPAVQYGGHAPVFPLDWQQGPLLGFVTVQGADPKVLAYAEYIRMHLMPRENFWTPLR